MASRLSFDTVQTIHATVLDIQGDAPGLARVLVATMGDVGLGDARQVGAHEGQALADLWGVPFIECSARESKNIDLVFETLLDQLEREEQEVPEKGCVVC